MKTNTYQDNTCLKEIFISPSNQIKSNRFEKPEVASCLPECGGGCAGGISTEGFF